MYVFSLGDYYIHNLLPFSIKLMNGWHLWWEQSGIFKCCLKSKKLRVHRQTYWTTSVLHSAYSKKFLLSYWQRKTLNRLWLNFSPTLVEANLLTPQFRQWAWHSGWLRKTLKRQTLETEYKLFTTNWNPKEEEPGRLQSMGLQRVGHDLATKHAHTRVF